MNVKTLRQTEKKFYRALVRVWAAVCRGTHKAYGYVLIGWSVFWEFFWRTAIILTAKFLSGASVRWVYPLVTEKRGPDGSPIESRHSSFLDTMLRVTSKAERESGEDDVLESCQRVYFANHTSHLDSIVIWTVLPGFLRRKTRMVAAQDYWDAGPFRRYLSKKVFNAILIDRKHVSIKNNPVNMLLREMGNEHSIIIFPEGGRGDGEKLRPFKSGIYHMAKKKPELEFIPIYLDNMNRILPRGKVLPVPMLSRVVFGPPIWIEEGELKDAFLGRCSEALLKLKDM